MAVSSVKYPHFKPSEFDSPDRVYHKERFPPTYDINEAMRVCELLRASLELYSKREVPLSVGSGYRSVQHNAVVPGSSKKSQHVIGTAFDLTPMIVSQYKSIYRIADLVSIVHVLRRYKSIPAGGLGIYDTHIHVDFRGKNVTWDKRNQS